MKPILVFLALVAGTLPFAACTHYVPASGVIPTLSEVAGVDIVTSTPGPGFSLGNRDAVARLVSFLRDECRWASAANLTALKKSEGAPASRIVIHRIDGMSVTIDVPGKVPGNLIVAAGYVARLSGSASARLDTLAGLERIRLHSF